MSVTYNFFRGTWVFISRAIFTTLEHPLIYSYQTCYHYVWMFATHKEKNYFFCLGEVKLENRGILHKFASISFYDFYQLILGNYISGCPHTTMLVDWTGFLLLKKYGNANFIVICKKGSDATYGIIISWGVMILMKQRLKLRHLTFCTCTFNFNETYSTQICTSVI